jgi:hypothetical protein
MISSDEMRRGLVADLGPSPSFVSLVMVDAAVNAAEHLGASNDPQWHRVFTETLQRLHLTKPQRPTQHVATEDDPWLPELAQAFGDLEGRVATADVWKILRHSSFLHTMDDHLRLTAVMRLLGWDRRLLRFRSQAVRGGFVHAQVGRGFLRGSDPRTIWVFICPVTGQVSYVGHNPAPSESMLPEGKDRRSVSAAACTRSTRERA